MNTIGSCGRLVNEIKVLEAGNAGHAYSHAQSLAYDLSAYCNVEVCYTDKVRGLEELFQSSSSKKILLISSLDHIFLRAFLRGPAFSNPRPLVVGVLHETRPLVNASRYAAWVLMHWLGQIDRVLVYSAPPSIEGICGRWFGLFLKVPQPLGEVSPVEYNGSRQLLFWGVITYEKGADRLTELCELLPDGFHVRVVGKCPDPSYKKQLSAEWAAYIESGKLIWDDGDFEEVRKIELLKSSVCLLAPYRKVHGRASAVAIDAVRHNIPIAYSVEHLWMAEYFANLKWRKVFDFKNLLGESRLRSYDALLSARVAWDCGVVGRGSAGRLIMSAIAKVL